MNVYFDAPERWEGQRLADELRAAGLSAAGVADVGGQIEVSGVNDADRDAVQSVIDAHDGTPTPPPPSPEDRIAALEAKVAAAERLAEQANVTAQEVAAALRDGTPGRPA